MTQEVKVDLQLHLEINATISKEEIKRQLQVAMNEIFEDNLIALDIHNIQEEAEIYKTRTLFSPCESCHTFKICKSENDCYVKFKKSKNKV